MEILTLNSQRLVEENEEENLLQFVERIKSKRPTVIGLHEVNQSAEAVIYPSVTLKGYTRCKGHRGVLRMDNHAVRIAEMLSAHGVTYYWTWFPREQDEGVYNEGIALFSTEPILETKLFPAENLSHDQDCIEEKILGVKTAHNGGRWYYAFRREGMMFEEAQ